MGYSLSLSHSLAAALLRHPGSLVLRPIVFSALRPVASSGLLPVPSRLSLRRGGRLLGLSLNSCSRRRRLKAPRPVRLFLPNFEGDSSCFSVLVVIITGLSVKIMPRF